MLLYLTLRHHEKSKAKQSEPSRRRDEPKSEQQAEEDAAIVEAHHSRRCILEEAHTIASPGRADQNTPHTKTGQPQHTISRAAIQIPLFTPPTELLLRLRLNHTLSYYLE